MKKCVIDYNGWLVSQKTPTPAAALEFPLFEHAPSVNTCTLFFSAMQMWLLIRFAIVSGEIYYLKNVMFVTKVQLNRLVDYFALE